MACPLITLVVTSTNLFLAPAGSCCGAQARTQRLYPPLQQTQSRTGPSQWSSPRTLPPTSCRPAPQPAPLPPTPAALPGVPA
jgi:hypothetical protein